MVKNDDFEFIMKPHYYCSYFKAFEAFTFELLIHDFFVHPDFRGKGLANNLMQELIRISNERKYCKITLEVREDNFVAQGLYSKQLIDTQNCKKLYFLEKIYKN